MLVLDVSGSMAARDSKPTRLGAAQAAAQRYVDKLPKGYRMALITFSDHTTLSAAPTHDLALVRAAIARARTGPQGTALADAVARAVDVGRSVPAKKGKTAAGRDRRLLRRRPDRRPGDAGAGRAARCERTHSRHGGGGRDARRGRATAGPGRVSPSGSRCRHNRRCCSRSRRGAEGSTSSGIGAVDVKATYAELGSRVGHTHKTVEVTPVAAAGGLAFMLAGAFLSGLWFRRLV